MAEDQHLRRKRLAKQYVDTAARCAGAVHGSTEMALLQLVGVSDLPDWNDRSAIWQEYYRQKEGGRFPVP